MRGFVFWTGIYNIIAGISFLVPGIVPLLGIRLPESNFWVWTVAVSVIYLGVALVLSSRRLAERATVVYWEGILRIVAFLLFGGYGFFGDLGIVAGILGVLDLVIGLVYLIGLPRTLGESAMDLLLDRVRRE
jgi:hypothetical protein